MILFFHLVNSWTIYIVGLYQIFFLMKICWWMCAQYVDYFSPLALVSARPHEFLNLKEAVDESMWSPWDVNMKYLDCVWYQGLAYTCFSIHWTIVSDLDTDVDASGLQSWMDSKEAVLTWFKIFPSLCFLYHSPVTFLSWDCSSEELLGLNRWPNRIDMGRFPCADVKAFSKE